MTTIIKESGNFVIQINELTKVYKLTKKQMMEKNKEKHGKGSRQA